MGFYKCDSSEGGSSGHTILDKNGTAYAQEDNLQFDDAIITDDSANGKTVVKSNDYVGTRADWDLMSAAEKAKYKKMYFTDDFNGMPIDSVPTQSSTNPVQSGGVYTALSGKQNTLTFDSTPTVNSTNPVTSGGVYAQTSKAYKNDDTTETTTASDDFIPFYDVSASAAKKILRSNFIAVGSTGTASASAVAYQYIKIGGTNYEIKGTKYMSQSKTVSTSNATTFTFTNSAITTSSTIDVYTDKFGVNPSDVTVTSGSCVVTIPKQSTAFSLGVKIHIE